MNHRYSISLVKTNIINKQSKYKSVTNKCIKKLTTMRQTNVRKRLIHIYTSNVAN